LVTTANRQPLLLSGIQSKRKMLSLNETKLERRSIARGELLFRQGDKVQAIYSSKKGGCGWTGARSMDAR